MHTYPYEYVGQERHLSSSEIDGLQRIEDSHVAIDGHGG